DGVIFTNIAGATSTTLTFATTAADNLKQYRAVFTNIAGSVPSNAATLSIATLPVVAPQRVNTTVPAGSNASFTSTATGAPAPTVQWQVSPDGVTFTNIPGATSTTLTFATTAGDNLKQYRAVFTNIAGSVPSNAATLSIATLPV